MVVISSSKAPVLILPCLARKLFFYCSRSGAFPISKDLLFSAATVMPDSTDTSVANIRAATSLINQGLHEEAVSILRHTLAGVHRSLTTSSHRTLVKTYRYGGPSCRQVNSSKLFTIETLDPEAFIESSENSNMFTVFDEAFVFRPGASTTRLELLHVQSLVLLFNIGLAYHKQGLMESRSEPMHCALEMYRACLEVVDLIYITNTKVHREVQSEMKFLALAVLNNIGHLHFYFFDRPNLLQCGKKIKEVLNSAIVPTGNPEFLRYLLVLVTTMSSSDQILSASPAA